MFQNRLGSLIAGRKFTILLCFTLYLRAISKYKPPGVLYLEGRFNEGFFCVTSLGGLIFGGAYFRNFTVFLVRVMSLRAYITVKLCGVTTILSPEPSNQIMAVQKSLCTSVECM